MPTVHGGQDDFAGQAIFAMVDSILSTAVEGCFKVSLIGAVFSEKDLRLYLYGRYGRLKLAALGFLNTSKFATVLAAWRISCFNSNNSI